MGGSVSKLKVSGSIACVRRYRAGANEQAKIFGTKEMK